MERSAAILLAVGNTVAATLAKYYPPTTRQPRGADVPKELAARIVKLKVGSATRRDVIALLGEPVSYVLGKEHFDANDLPSRFAMIYSGNVQVIVSDDRVLRITILAPGYLFREAIEVGTSVEKVFKVLGPPRKTVDNAAFPHQISKTEHPDQGRRTRKKYCHQKQ